MRLDLIAFWILIWCAVALILGLIIGPMISGRRKEDDDGQH